MVPDGKFEYKSVTFGETQTVGGTSITFHPGTLLPVFDTVIPKPSQPLPRKMPDLRDFL